LTEADLALEVSVARPSDYKAIRRLCRRAVGPDDYVLRILRDVINGRGLYLAWVGEQLVGMTNLDKCIDGSGWLSMARTDPDWQGRGVARFLQRELAKRSKKHDVGVFRLWTLSTNYASIRACEKGGFHQVCQSVHVSHNFRSKIRCRQYPQLTSNLNSMTNMLESSYLSRMQGYFAYKRHFVKADETLIEKMRRKRELISLNGLTFILTKPESSFHKLSCSFSLLEGDPARSMRLILSGAKNLGAERVGGYLPYDRPLLDLSSKIGFKVDRWGYHCLVFEKTVS
jgi:GNAT superfamily N-acetyltransferase